MTEPSDDMSLAGQAARARARRGLFGAAEDVPRIGRFAVLRMLGQGGMGTVYAAYDEQLDRRVAVKVLRRDVDERSRLRVEREARAMAKLTHPNVVQVYEVGGDEGSLHIAMEYVAGETLGDWQRASERTKDEILDAYLQAGEGLAAAHAAGLVHRDFKPHNAMVEALPSGRYRARVLDFGLARLTEGVRSEEDLEDLPASNPASGSDGKLTATGGVVGTPAYMAPEQFARADVTAAADQFSFCVALWEALSGERPFSGRTAPELVASMDAGKLQSGPGLPARTRAALTRGLSLDPGHRFGSMSELLAALKPRPPRPWWQIGAALSTVGVATATVLWAGPDKELCKGAEAQLAGAWDEARRAEVQAAMLQTGVPAADETWEGTAKALDAYSDAWQQGYTEACEATSVRGEQSADVMDQRMACLHGAKVQLRAVVDVFSNADAEVMRNAGRVLGALRPAAQCADIERLAQAVPPPDDPEVKAVVEAVREDLAAAVAMRHAGKFAEGLAVATRCLEEARTLGYGPFLAEALEQRGYLLDITGALAEAEASMREAYTVAVASEHDLVAARAATTLVWIVGYKQGRYKDGIEWGVHAEALETRLSKEGTSAGLLSTLAHIHRVNGAFEEAKPLAERALAIQAKTLEPDDRRLTISISSLADLEFATGQYDEAMTLYKRALAILEKSVGPKHPEYAGMLLNVANIHHVEGDYAEARRLSEQALAIQEAVLGPEHADVAISLANLGLIAYETNAYDEAESSYERALEIRKKALGPDHPDVAQVLTKLGHVHASRGAVDEARTLYEQALTIYDALVGVQNGELDARFNEARALLETGGDRQRALDLATSAADGYRKEGKAREKQLAEVEAWLSEHAPPGD